MKMTEGWDGQQFVRDIRDRPVTFEIELTRRRKTRIGINFEAFDRVRLEAPVRTSLDELQALVSAHERWFAYRLQRVAEESPVYRPPAYEHGELILHRGEPLKLCICFDDDARAEANLSNAQGNADPALVVTLPGEIENQEALVRRLVRRFQTGEAKTVFADTLLRFVDKIDWLNAVPAWRTGFMRSQWGSCNESGKLALNTHLVKLPQALVDYVLVHELCHLKQMNHGKRFQGLMDAHLPDWRDRQNELNRFGGLLGET